MIRDQRVKTLWKAGFEKFFRNPQILARRLKESHPLGYGKKNQRARAPWQMRASKKSKTRKEWLSSSLAGYLLYR